VTNFLFLEGVFTKDHVDSEFIKNLQLRVDHVAQKSANFGLLCNAILVYVGERITKKGKRERIEREGRGREWPMIFRYTRISEFSEEFEIFVAKSFLFFLPHNYAKVKLYFPSFHLQYCLYFCSSHITDNKRYGGSHMNI
jgi:hypothetical protein